MLRCQAVIVADREVRVCPRDALTVVTSRQGPWPHGYLLCRPCLFAACRTGQYDNAVVGYW